MAKRYTEEWKNNVSKGVKAYREEHPLSDETRAKLSESAKKGNSIRKYVRKDLEDLKQFHRVRERLFEERGRKCEQCGWEQINSHHGIIPVQVEHIDGNRDNNTRTNLIILCPNCHSLTKHFMFYGRSHKGTYGQKGTVRYR